MKIDYIIISIVVLLIIYKFFSNFIIYLLCLLTGIYIGYKFNNYVKLIF